VVPESRTVQGFPQRLVLLEGPGLQAVRGYCAELDSRSRQDLLAVCAVLGLLAVLDAHGCRRRRNESPLGQSGRAAPKTRRQLRIRVSPQRFRIPASRREQCSKRARRDLTQSLGQASQLARSRRAKTPVPSHRQSGPRPGGSAEGCDACPAFGSLGPAPADRGGLPRPEPGGHSAAGTGARGSGRR
jgi:hypothetical protein